MIQLASDNEPTVKGMSGDILAQERAKIVTMLNDLADLKFFSKGTQRKRLQDMEQILRLALLENGLELRHIEVPDFEEGR